MCELEQLIQTGGCDNALDYFCYNLALKFCPLALSDVARHALHAHRDALLIDQPSANLDGNAPPVLCPHLDFVGGQSLAFQLLANVCTNLRCICRSHELGKISADDFVACVANKLLGSPVCR